MDVTVLQKVDLRRISESREVLVFRLDDAFFQALDQSEILGGDVEATVSARQTAGGIYQLRLSARGQVSTQCDRCLDPVSLPVETEDTLRAVHDDEDFASEAELLLTDRLSDDADLRWTLYELIVTALPLERCHAEGDCNPDMVARISGVVDTTRQEEEN
ncbi:MAG: DUF177 domain-containing protein [Alloprevotella sp.]|nr:DUF177 domain-containing protein [Alloprevotella sp.]